nr:MAG TPA: hypothetical protein [Caudoviricetes sp.]DAK63502.1 MAG TPA: hypothetical protein [Caudoviricetes sp.]DAS31438.1 MAG TPA: hypothetical protein [Caudoviricetes sp.]
MPQYYAIPAPKSITNFCQKTLSKFCNRFSARNIS